MMLVIYLLLNQNLLLLSGILDFLLADIYLTLIFILKGSFNFCIASTKSGYQNKSMVG